MADSRARLELAIGSADIGIWDWDLISGGMTYCARAKAICGFAEDDAVTYEMVVAVTHPEDLPHTSAQASRALDPAINTQLVASLKALGYQYVSLDLQGYRLGSLNEALRLRPVS